VQRCPVSRDLVHVSLELDPRACLTQSGPHGEVQGLATAAGQAGTRSGVPKSIGLRVENQRLRTRVGELVALDS
jgi:hypothetical protein